MTALVWLIPAALFLGALGLVAFLWSLRTGQFEDLDGAAWRALEDRPAGPPVQIPDETASERQRPIHQGGPEKGGNGPAQS